ncbi:MAG: magnesium transporter [Actinobacteria bacterium]|nr:MAG: magnesium transporter [Actinomycetota bacterium]
MKARNKILLTAIKNLLAKGEIKRATLILNRVHSVDAAEIIENLDDEQRQKIFQSWSAHSSAEALLEMDEYDQVEVAHHLDNELIADIIEEMPADDATDLLGDLEPDETEDIISLMKTKAAVKVKQLLKYGKNTAGGIMTPEFVSLRKTKTADQALQKVRKAAKGTETIYNLFVVNDENQLVGALSLRDLLIASPEIKIKEIMNPDLINVEASTDQEDAAHLMAKYDLLVMPVVDEEQHLLGIITIDDVVDVLEEEATEDMYRMSGASEFESDVAETSLAKATRSRIPWLILALVGEVILVGAVAARFSFLYKAVPALGIYWAAMTSIGGNTSFQAATVAVRGLAVGPVDSQIIRRRIRRELLLSFSISVITTIVLFVLVLVANSIFNIGNVLEIALIVASANIAIIITGAFTGAIIPIVFHRLKIDPAVSSSPLLALMMDALSLLIYFSIAFGVLSAFGTI